MMNDEDIIEKVVTEFHAYPSYKQLRACIRKALEIKDEQNKKPEHIQRGTPCWVSDDSPDERNKIRLSDGEGGFLCGLDAKYPLKWKYATPIHEYNPDTHYLLEKSKLKSQRLFETGELVYITPYSEMNDVSR